MVLSAKNRQVQLAATLHLAMLGRTIDMELFVIRNLKAIQILREIMTSSKRGVIKKVRTRLLAISRKSTS